MWRRQVKLLSTQREVCDEDIFNNLIYRGRKVTKINSTTKYTEGGMWLRPIKVFGITRKECDKKNEILSIEMEECDNLTKENRRLLDKYGYNHDSLDVQGAK